MTKEEIKNMLYSLHHSTFRNEQQIKNSQQCGRFHCGSLFSPEEVTNWCDCDGRGDRTGLCPNCMIDSVVCDRTGFIVSPTNLKLMNLEFFGGGVLFGACRQIVPQIISCEYDRHILPCQGNEKNNH